MNIGFIGLGIMGSRMAANLQKAGHSLVLFNRTRAKAEPLLAAGARWATQSCVCNSPSRVKLILPVILSAASVPEKLLVTELPRTWRTTEKAMVSPFTLPSAIVVSTTLPSRPGLETFPVRDVPSAFRVNVVE